MNSYYLAPQIPIMNENIRPSEREKILSSLQEVKASRFWIAWERSTLFLSDRSAKLQSLKENWASKFLIALHTQSP